MYKSKEIRWFTSTEDQQITRWFEGQGIAFGNTEPRTDYYLPLGNKDDLSIKLREGNIEVKQRWGKPRQDCLTSTVEGYFENWVKWSFKADRTDPLSRAIIDEKKYDWIEIRKKRIGIKLTYDETGTMKMVNIKDIIPFGIQLEYTQLQLQQQEYFTFALEWFGERMVGLDFTLVAEILGDTVLKPEDSMGYGEFLKLKG